MELAAHIQTADKFTRATAGSKLQIIADQLKYLQDQARKVLEDARLNALIHKTACNFKKVPGTTYYVYKNRKNPDTEFISMISPQVSQQGPDRPDLLSGSFHSLGFFTLT